ncbi:16S rRNA (uracil(1498)-N(3))-methyltransferase [Nakamurella endophytica]|uniref:Ribosomal RNA small subunit methyltransferase E n=1 Tax=Nakamurella endophytica TaxID=1748367 RepID=A0A917SIQ2_9ACTN|nr:16S rRNA (uracil(1498)-N(3))-methyltransferase [Nakamurella endophytica]GGL84440.1 ribosomal RNA small subunit methyltransferase E [Nakamurella endophytica]
MAVLPHGAAVFLVDAVVPGLLELAGAEGRHALVRRLRTGETVVVADGAGGWATARVTAVQRGGVVLDVGPVARTPEPDVRVLLVQALPKGERGELAVDLATEAGVDGIVPWAAARCVVRWTDDERAGRGVQRWQAAAREAAKQARRPWVPEVHPLATTADVLRRAAGCAAVLVLHEDADVPLTRVPLPSGGTVMVVVGPEGGITDLELAEFVGAGGVPVRLGPQVLRSSTAGAVALGALGVLAGRWPG